MAQMVEKNARIESTMLGVESHGILTAFVHVAGDGWGCGFGGYSLDGPHNVDGKFAGRIGSAFGMEWIRRVLDVLEAQTWETLPGTIVRVRLDEPFGKIVAIGHAYKERWFTPATDLAHMREVTR